jgi:hypothetical protein
MLTLPILALVLLFPPLASSAVVFYDNEADWLSALGGVGLVSSAFDTTASNMALATEVASAPVDGTNMGKTLNFLGASTGLAFDFRVTAPLGGPTLANLSYAGSAGAGAFSPAGSNDNFKVDQLVGESVFAFGLTVAGNTSTIDTSANLEGFFVTTTGADGTLFGLPLTTAFVGAISTDAIVRVIADEGDFSTDSNVRYSNFRFATTAAVPAPATLLLFVFGLAGLGVRAGRRARKMAERNGATPSGSVANGGSAIASGIAHR